MKLLASIAFASLLVTQTAYSQNAKQPRRAGQLIIKLKSNVKSNAMRSLNGLGFVMENEASQSGLVTVRMNQKSTKTEEQMASELMATGLVEFAEPDYLFEQADTIPDDSRYNEQWMHKVMQTPAAWDHTIGDERIIAAVCDSGVDASHPELAGRVLRGYNAVDGSTVTTPHTTHGTYVAGLIAAAGNNKMGIAGMAWRTLILPVRITTGSKGSAYSSDMAECIEWSADNGAKVINLSFTGFASRSIDSAAQYARARGALLFMAAGNQGNNVSSSPDYKSFILVGSTTNQDKRSSFSNYGTPIDLVAPGSAVLSTLVGGGYSSINGTSFSSPVAAGLGALVWSINPDFTPDEVESILYQTTDKVGAEATFGNGRINAARAIASALEQSSGDKLPTARATLPTGRMVAGRSYEFSAHDSSDDQGLVRFRWEFSDGQVLEGMTVKRLFTLSSEIEVRLTVWDTAGQTHSTVKKFKTFATESLMMSVSDIRMKVFYSRTYSRTESNVTILDEEGNAVVGADVTVDINGTTLTARTNSQGVAFIEGPRFGRNVLHFLTVKNVVQNDFEYNSELNQRSTGSIRVR